MAAPEGICDEHAELIRRLARKFYARQRARLLDFDAVLQCVRIGVWVASKRCAPNPVSEALAWVCSRDWVTREFRAVAGRGIVHGLNRDLPADLPDVGPIPMGRFDAPPAESDGRLDAALAGMGEKETAVACRLANYQESGREAACELGIPYPSFRKIAARVAAKLIAMPQP